MDNKITIPFWNEYNYDSDQPLVSKVTVEYAQTGDCCENRDNIQTLILTTEDGGGGPFIRMSIPNNGHWSISDETELVNLIQDFKARLNYEF